MRWTLDYQSKRAFEHDLPDQPLGDVNGAVRAHVATARFVAKRMLVSDAFLNQPELSVHLAGDTALPDMQIAICGAATSAIESLDRTRATLAAEQIVKTISDASLLTPEPFPKANL